MNYLIYVAQGSAVYRGEALYNLLSYFEVTPALLANVLIYTDDPDAFRRVLGNRPDVQYPAVSAADWKAWRGAFDMPYMLKINVLEHAATHYPGNLLFLDTDTIWHRDPTPIFEQIEQGVRFMHEDEGTLKDGSPLSRKIYRRLGGREFQAGTTQVRIGPDSKMYNSGAVGLRSQDAHVLRDVVQLADTLYATYCKPVMEQLACCTRFALDGPVQEVAPYAIHYWNVKAARPLLIKLFDEYQGGSHADLLACAHRIDLPALQKTEMAYRILPNWRRTLLKLVGRQYKEPRIQL